jgi:hypothetical protein
MKCLYIIAGMLLLVGNAVAQKTDLMRDKMFMAKVKNNEISVRINIKSFLAAVNESFPYENYNKLEIKQDTTLGETKASYYYVVISSDTYSPTIVRWLSNENGKLFMETTPKGQISYKDVFFSCKGAGDCAPHIYTEGVEQYWICGESPYEQSNEELNGRPCEHSVTVMAKPDF